MDGFKLQYEMKRRGVTAEELSAAVGISKSAFYRKMHGKTEFTQSEIQKIVDYLNLGTPMGIFFACEVS